MSRPLLLVDSYAQIFRAYFAIRVLTTSRGEPVNAIFGMSKLLMKLQTDFAGYDGIFAFDMGKPPHRLALAPAYKANRPPCPEDLKAQLEPLNDMIHAFGWKTFRRENWEADDIIAGIVKAMPDRKIVILSADKDLAQLISPRVDMMIPSHDGKGFERRSEAEAQAKFGVRPDQILDYLALIGDNADNIPGIEGVGPKTAAALLQECGSIEAMLADPARITKEKLRAKIVDGAETLKKNVGLIRLVSEPPEGVTWSDADFVRTEPDYERLKSFADRYEMKTFRKELDQIAPESCAEPDLFQAPASKPEAPKLEQPELF